MLLQTLTIGGNSVVSSPTPGGPALPPSTVTDNVPYSVEATNNPAAGSNIVIDLPDTSGFFVGGYVIIGSKGWTSSGFAHPTITEVTKIISVVTDVSITVAILINSYTTPDVYSGVSVCGEGVTNVSVAGGPGFEISVTTKVINGLGDDAQVSGPFRPDNPIYVYGLGGINGTPQINGKPFNAYYLTSTPPAGAGGTNTIQLNSIDSLTIPIDGQFIGSYTTGGDIVQRYCIAEMPIISADDIIMEYPQPDQYIHTPDPVYSTQVIEAGTGSRGNRGFN